MTGSTGPSPKCRNARSVCLNNAPHAPRQHSDPYPTRLGRNTGNDAPTETHDVTHRLAHPGQRRFEMFEKESRASAPETPQTRLEGAKKNTDMAHGGSLCRRRHLSGGGGAWPGLAQDRGRGSCLNVDGGFEACVCTSCTHRGSAGSTRWCRGAGGVRRGPLCVDVCSVFVRCTSSRPCVLSNRRRLHTDTLLTVRCTVRTSARDVIGGITSDRARLRKALAA